MPLSRSAPCTKRRSSSSAAAATIATASVLDPSSESCCKEERGCRAISIFKTLQPPLEPRKTTSGMLKEPDILLSNVTECHYDNDWCTQGVPITLISVSFSCQLHEEVGRLCVRPGFRRENVDKPFLLCTTTTNQRHDLAVVIVHDFQ